MTSRLAPLVLVPVLALTACGSGTSSGGPGPSNATSSFSTPSPAGSSPTVDVSAQNAAYGVRVPAGLVLTAPGTGLSMGQAASIAWAPKTGGPVYALQITVNRVRKGTMKDFAGFTLTPEAKASTPYYVGATLKDIGPTIPAAVSVPLWVVNGQNTLLGANTFGGTFTACTPNVLPKKLTTGSSVNVCMVYLAANHGSFAAVSFRPGQDFDPITWTGTVQTSSPAPNAAPKKK